MIMGIWLFQRPAPHDHEPAAGFGAGTGPVKQALIPVLQGWAGERIM
jgi:hypothetical protein